MKIGSSVIKVSFFNFYYVIFGCQYHISLKYFLWFEIVESHPSPLALNVLLVDASVVFSKKAKVYLILNMLFGCFFLKYKCRGRCDAEMEAQ